MRLMKCSVTRKNVVDMTNSDMLVQIQTASGALMEAVLEEALVVSMLGIYLNRFLEVLHLVAEVEAVPKMALKREQI